MVKTSIKRNYIYNLLYQILAMLIPLITTPYLSRVLGVENIGIYSYTISITTYFILFGSLGVAMYGQREIAYLQNSIEERSKTFFEILLMRFITSGLSIILFYFFFCLKGEYNLYYKILLLEIVASSLDISWYFQGMEEFKKTIIRNIIIKISSVLCIFLLVKNQGDLSTYFFIYVLSNFLGNASLWLYLPKNVTKVSLKKLNLIKHLKPTIILFIPQIAIQIYTVLDKTMLGLIISDKSEVGFYEQSQKIIKFLMTLATSLGIVMMPRIAATFASGNKEKVKEYMYKSFSFIMLLAIPLMFGLISISFHFVPIFFGDGFDKVVPLLCIGSPIIFIIALSNVIGMQYLLPTKQQKKFTISVTIGAIANFLLNLIFINIWESIGATIATVIAECIVTLVQFYLVRDDFKIVDILRMAKKYFVASIIMFMWSYCIGYAISNDLASLIIQTISSVIIYFAILITFQEQMVMNGFNSLKSKFKK